MIWPIPGGACDGYQYTDIGYVMRGGREMDNHFECMWDLFLRGLGYKCIFCICDGGTDRASVL